MTQTDVATLSRKLRRFFVEHSQGLFDAIDQAVAENDGANLNKWQVLLLRPYGELTAVLIHLGESDRRQRNGTAFGSTEELILTGCDLIAAQFAPSIDMDEATRERVIRALREISEFELMMSLNEEVDNLDDEARVWVFKRYSEWRTFDQTEYGLRLLNPSPLTEELDQFRALTVRINSSWESDANRDAYYRRIVEMLRHIGRFDRTMAASNDPQEFAPDEDDDLYHGRELLRRAIDSGRVGPEDGESILLAVADAYERERNLEALVNDRFRVLEVELIAFLDESDS